MKKWLCVLAVSSVFIGCEEKEDDQIYSAQICLNSATAGTVDACLAKISGVSSARAFVLRCSAEFIRANITTSTIVTAIENIEDNDAGNTEDPTIEFYNQFSFTSTASADTAVNYCSASGSEGLKLLALSAKTATVIKYDILGGTLDLNALTNYTPDPDNNSTDKANLISIGETILDIAPIACNQGDSLQKTEVCDNINRAKEGVTVPTDPNDQAAWDNYYSQIGENFYNNMKTSDN